MVYVFLADGFEEVEAIAPIDFLRRCGVSVTTVSLVPGPVRGAHGISVFADQTLSEAEFSDAAMIVLPGGMPGTVNLDACPQMSEILSSVSEKGGFLAAICAAPLVLGKRGYLEGKRAVCYPGFESDLLGATVVSSPVVRDGNVITAKSAGVAWEFGYTLAEVLVGRDVCETVRKNLFLPAFGD